MQNHFFCLIGLKYTVDLEGFFKRLILFYETIPLKFDILRIKLQLL
jgi:hypothetical protein